MNDESKMRMKMEKNGKRMRANRMKIENAMRKMLAQERQQRNRIQFEKPFQTW